MNYTDYTFHLLLALVIILCVIWTLRKRRINRHSRLYERGYSCGSNAYYTQRRLGWTDDQILMHAGMHVQCPTDSGVPDCTHYRRGYTAAVQDSVGRDLDDRNMDIVKQGDPK